MCSTGIASPATYPNRGIVIKGVRQQMLQVIGYLLLLSHLGVIVLLRWLVDVMHCSVFD